MLRKRRGGRERERERERKRKREGENIITNDCTYPNCLRLQMSKDDFFLILFNSNMEDIIKRKAPFVQCLGVIYKELYIHLEGASSMGMITDIATCSFNIRRSET